MEFADRVRRLGVRANADTPEDARVAVAFGAEGIGLCRTEHMFFGPHRISAVRMMILAEGQEAREQALARLEPMQRDDFAGIFRAMGGRPVTIRLLDPPLHEFLPNQEEQFAEIARELGVPAKDVTRKARELREQNPMLGHRGCRLGLTFPEIYEMQVRAILEAALLVRAEGVPVRPEIMIPLVGIPRELEILRERAAAVATAVFARAGRAVRPEPVEGRGDDVRIDYLFGTMIEVPRAALLADELAASADFMSFGTNDLTQCTFAVSRDDSGTFLPAYEEMEIIARDPFAVLDRKGVGEIMRIGVERGRKARPTLKVGICGEHGGEPSSVAFCHELGLDYVSCSPFRVPVARLAAAHAALAERGGKVQVGH
jgi:pyruvate,orthophosphate dikinase